MEESILKTIRKMIGGQIIEEGESGPFDMDLIVHINSILQTLNQLGVGKEDFEITGESESWAEFLGMKFRNLNWIKSYVYLKVKMLFDPSGSSTLMEAMKEQAAELEWRINTKVDKAYRDPIKFLCHRKDTIMLTRGDTYMAKVSATIGEDEYVPDENDVITFTVKRTYDDVEPALTKVIPHDTMLLVLEPNDTKEMDYGAYVYDIQITFDDGSVSTIIPRAAFIVREEVT